MENQTAKTRITLGSGAIDSPLNSLFCQKTSVCDENFNQKSKNPFKNLAIILNLFQHLINKHSLKKDLCLLISCEDGQMLKQVQHDVGFMSGYVVVLSDNGDKQLNKLINQELENNAKIKPSCRSYRYRRQERSSSRTRQVCSQLVFSASVKKLRACYFGIYPINDGNNKFDIFYFKILTFIFFFFGLATQKRRKQNQKKKKRRLRSALTVNLCNISFKKETGCAFYGVRGRCVPPEPPSKATKSLRRRYAPQNSIVQIIAPQGLTPQGLAQC